MKVHRELAGSLPEFRNAVITIGTFDGVHKGHQQILSQLKEEATKIGGETVIVTFHPHPRKIVSSVPGDVKLLNTQAEKKFLLEKAGIDHLVVVPFDHHFANQSAEEYIVDFLYKYFNPHTIIIGYDHRFGKGRTGDYHLLEKYGQELGFAVKEIPEQLLHEIAVSSTRIRKAIIENDIATANAALGYPYFFEGLVVEGNQLGRTIGYPTANLHIGSEEKLIPGNGVYAVQVQITDKTYGGMMNIGLRPTVDGKKRVIEVNIFDFNDNIYGEQLRIHVRQQLRNEIKFDGLEALKAQLGRDKADAVALLRL
ncbi:bifunctional riboflavin kinase/FAD synthetase [Sediminibacterium goheungense]|uniref:Riboflavin biosynthesis protein n=1 Tax=Sediminibacterium goheungense TaxID=1086393 RepID=A0A4R6IZH3_9BACT|nr:bifunctional riboflavin kinase/FAD synthetase [Sediminibacterium goheungense]TDO28253.1 riboflavin kinase/FMN adenylyltransferase [Sediminibacterium goheungense]